MNVCDVTTFDGTIASKGLDAIEDIASKLLAQELILNNLILGSE